MCLCLKQTRRCAVRQEYLRNRPSLYAEQEAGRSKQEECQQAQTNHIPSYYIFTYASIAGLQLVGKSLKGAHSHQEFCSARSAVSKGRSMLKYAKRLSLIHRMKSRSSRQRQFRLDGLPDTLQLSHGCMDELVYKARFVIAAYREFGDQTQPVFC